MALVIIGRIYRRVVLGGWVAFAPIPALFSASPQLRQLLFIYSRGAETVLPVAPDESLGGFPSLTGAHSVSDGRIRIRHHYRRRPSPHAGPTAATKPTPMAGMSADRADRADRANRDP